MNPNSTCESATAHHSLLVGDEGVWFEVCVYPLKTFDNCEVGFLIDGSITWGKSAAKVRQILNTDFWDETGGYLCDRKLPDGSMINITTANATIALLWNMIDPDKAGKALDRMSEPDMIVPWGLRTNSSLDNNYRSGGYHAGTVWPLVTGRGSLAAYNNHKADQGLHYLKANADLTWDFCSGYITEVLDGDNREPIGYPHQGWSEATVILPVVAGLLGIRVDAVNKTIALAPQIPNDWRYFRVSSIQAGENRLNISYERRSDKTVVTLERTDGDDHYTAFISLASAQTVSSIIGGDPAVVEIKQAL